jgi:hypothetical protein
MVLELDVTHAVLTEVGCSLIQRHLICTTGKTWVTKLNRIIFPVANRANEVRAWWGFV